MDGNTLYYGDNLDILREQIADESVDLIYLDPPFNSNRSYNVLFKEATGKAADAQITAFDDSWHWTEAAEETLHDIAERAPAHVVEMMEALVRFVGRNDMSAYLVMMTARLVELHRVLKPTGSLYLHCDPTASHYLKILLDSVFGPTNFRNEIIWKRTTAHSSAKKYGPVHDTIIYYVKSDDHVWNPQFLPHSKEYLTSKYRYTDAEGRVYRLDNLTAAGVRHGSSGRPWRGIDPSARGYHWKFTVENLERLDAEGRLYWPQKQGGIPQYKRYLDEVAGIALQDIWDDIPPINSQAAERLGYPTQKPLALLERIISASSNPGDVVLDPFCGCGTSVCAAQKLGRRWIGIDVTHLAIALMRNRLEGMFGEAAEYEIVGQPADLASAEALARQDRYQFQSWALSLIKARPAQDKKGADQGLDGVLFFLDEARKPHKKVVIQVKSGHVQAGTMRDLAHVVEREKAVMGFLISLERPTQPMLREALASGYYHSPGWNRDYPRMQVRTIEQLLAREWFEFPQANVTLAGAERVQPETEQRPLL